MNVGAVEFVPGGSTSSSSYRTHKVRTNKHQSRNNSRAQEKKTSTMNNRELALQMFSFDDVASRDGGADEIDRSATGGFKARGDQHQYQKGPVMTRAQYTMANNRFVVGPFIEASHASLYDPDTSLPWEHVEAMISTNENSTSCCICMGTLFVPNATRCGHIFCLTCVMRYLYFDGEGGDGYVAAPSQKCPLCNHSVCLKDLRPFTFLPDFKAPTEARPFTLRLMTIEKGSMFSRVACSGGSGSYKGSYSSRSSNSKELLLSVGSIVPAAGSPDAKFNRVSLVSMQWILDQIRADRDKLLHYHTRCVSSGDNMGFEEIETLPGYVSADVEYLPAIAHALDALQQKEENINAKVNSLSQSKKAEVKQQHGTSTARNTAEIIESVPLLLDGGPCYFYQCDSGGLVFLHPICMRCILTNAQESESQALSSLLTAQVLEVESVRVTRESRSRIPFLRHLPEHCDLVSLIEIDMTDIVKPEVYVLFADDIAKRKARRKKVKQAQHREKRDDSDRLLAQAIEQEELMERHRQLKEQEARELEELRRGPRAGVDGADDGDDSEWPSAPGVAARVDAFGEVHSFSNIATTMGFFPELGTVPPPPTAGQWARPGGSRESSFDDTLGGKLNSSSGSRDEEGKSQSRKKNKGSNKGTKIDLKYTFS
jgi:hypothetical protein